MAVALWALAATWLVLQSHGWPEIALPDPQLALPLIAIVAGCVAVIAGWPRARRGSLDGGTHQLARPQGWLRAVLDTMGDAVIATDASGRVTFQNALATALTGWSAGAAVGRPVVEVFTAVDEHTREPVADVVRAALEAGPSRGAPRAAMLIARNGDETPVEYTVSPVRDDDGDVTGILLVLRAVTARREAEAALQAAEERFQAFMHNTPIVAWAKDEDGRYVFVNRAFARRLRRGPPDMLGRTDAEFFSPEVADEFRRNDLEVLRTGRDLELMEDTVDEAGRRWSFLTFKFRFEDASGTRYVGGVALDLTERKRMEGRLQETAARLRLAQQVALVGTFEWNIQTGVNVCTPELEAMYGVAPGSLSGTLPRWRATVHPDDRQKILQLVAQALDGGDFEGEWRAVWPDGTTRWIHGRASVFPDEHGRPQKMIGVNIDVTERKRAEDQARRWERVFQEARFGMSLASMTDNVFLAVNPSYAREHGYAPEELVGRPVLDVYPPELHEEVRRLVAAGDASGHAVYESVHVRKDGSRYPVLVELTVVSDADGRAATRVAHTVDITARKQAEAALRQSEEHFRGLAEALPQIVWTANPDGSVAWLNQRWHDFTAQDARLAEAAGWHSVIHPDDLAHTLELWEHARRAGTVYETETRYRRKDGTYRWFLARAWPMRDANGRITRWIGTSTDVHDLKRAEAELRATQRTAEHAKELAEQASRAKDHFMAVLSHELRTPLTPVLAVLSKLRVDSRLPSDALDSVDMIRRNVELETRLIDDLLDMTRIARGKVDLARQRLDFREVIQWAIEVCRPDIEARRLRFGVALCGDGGCWVDGDAARLQQVVWNLLKNAIKFTPPGGAVGVSCVCAGPHAILEVDDSGEGIDSAALHRIFDAFEQGERAITRQFGGLGLGLTISKALVELHGGTIEAQSAGRGRGSTFRVRLPLVAAAEALPVAAPAAAAAVTPRAAPLRILLVEDHGDTAQVMGDLLRHHGFVVETAAGVQHALELAARQGFDLLVSDLGLPDRSGLELVHELRSRGQSFPAIALSGFGLDEDLRRSRNAGFAAHLTKPIDFDRLYLAIAEVTGRTD